MSLEQEIQKRRTFAIIAHPDAGKTTLTEKLLLYGGAIQLAGAVKARKEKKSAQSDWMEMEKERGISITSAALQFEYKNHVFNLLDTPGHEDFSEDTYRTLMAADSAIMVLDAGKGVEPQTIKLFKVCRERNIPILTFINKMDRPVKDLFTLLDEIENVLGIAAIPIVWPVGTGPDFKGVYDIQKKEIHLFEKTSSGKKAAVKATSLDNPEFAANMDEYTLKDFREAIELIEGGMEYFREEDFLKCMTTPVFFGSAVNNFGLELFLEYFMKIAPPPVNIELTDGTYLDPAKHPFSGFVFKVQANMNKAHRDRIAFIRISSGKFTRGLNVNHDRTGGTVKLSSSFAFFGQDRNTVDEAWPGDIIGLVNPGTFRIGDIISTGTPPPIKPLPVFAPELFATISSMDTMSLKGFKKGIEQLAEEGILHAFTSRFIGGGYPIIGAMGRLQFEVFQRRLKDEYRAETNIAILPYTVARWVKKEVAGHSAQMNDVNGNTVLLFESEWEMGYFQKNNPDVELLEHPPVG